jgi:hypothetical protein
LTWENTGCRDTYWYQGKDTFEVQRNGRRAGVVDPALAWSQDLQVEVSGSGVVAHAGVVLPRLLADRLGLTGELRAVVARAGFTPVRDRGRALVDTVCALVTGATCLSDVEALTRQEKLFGPGGGASDTTVLRVLDELAQRLGADGLPGRRLARALARTRAAAWGHITAAGGGVLPAVQVAGQPLVRAARVEGQAPRPVTVVRIDATIIDSATMKEQVTAHYKHGIGYHPLTAWCTNVGDNLALMQRTGNAGSFTAADHVKVIEAALAQVPAAHRGDVLVTIDGAGASHEVLDHLAALNTAKTAGGRGRRIEYSIGWPIDARTKGALARVRDRDWTPGLRADARVETDAEVVDLTGILRHSVGGDELAGWPPDMRLIARRTPRADGEQAELGEDADFRYGAFVTNTPAGQVQWLDARHRTQAHVEDKMKELKATGADKLPSASWDRNHAWIQLAALAVTLTAWLRHLGLDGDLAKAEPKALRFRLLATPARLVHHARKRILKIPTDWAWADHLAGAYQRIYTLHPA